jgi:hypothetical protein
MLDITSTTLTKCTHHISYTMLLHVLVYLTPSSERTYVFLTQKTPAFLQFIICGTVVVSLKIQLCWFTAMMRNGTLQNKLCTT